MFLSQLFTHSLNTIIVFTRVLIKMSILRFKPNCVVGTSNKGLNKGYKQ